MSDRLFSVYILGAGFSRAAGFPLGNELMKLVLDAAPEFGREFHIEKDLKRFVEYKKRVDQKDVTRETVLLEEFLSFLDIEHFFALRGKDTWSDEGNPSQLAIRYVLSRLLFERLPPSDSPLWKPYDEFARRLEPNDILVTFNYDTLVETALDRVKKPYRLVPESHSSGKDDEVILLKMHGSVDWFDINSYLNHIRFARSQPFFSHPRCSIFQESRRFQPECIADDYYAGRPLRSIYRVRDLAAYFARGDHGLTLPFIVSPSFSKMLYMNPLRDFWYSFDSLGRYHYRISVIGYSLPNQDQYVRQAVAGGIINFQTTEGLQPTKKKRLKMIDCRPNDPKTEEYKQVYSFVDWERTDCHWGGFGMEAVKMIFDGQ